MTLPTHPLPLRPPWSGAGRKIQSKVRKLLYECNLESESSEDAAILVALSGGKDSITMLAQLKAVLGHGFPSWKLHACFVDGKYTCGAGVNQKFLRQICEQLNVPLHICQSDIPLEKLECYSCSRKRRTLLFNCAKEIGAGYVAFGHHREDQIETLLMNLFHKAEFAGLLPKVPMKKYGVTILRPLLFVSEAEIIEFAKQYGFYRITCQCPVGQNSLRKQTGKFLEEAEKVYPRIRHNLHLAVQEYGSNKALEP